MNNQDFKNILQKIIDERFKGKARKYSLAAGVNYNTLMNYLKRGSKPNPEILTKLARAAGVSIEELYGEKQATVGGIVCEPVIQYEGQERRRNWPYSNDEQEFVNMLIGILRGKNEAIKKVIIENIKAFYEIRDVEIPGEFKKANNAR